LEQIGLIHLSDVHFGPIPANREMAVFTGWNPHDITLCTGLDYALLEIADSGAWRSRFRNHPGQHSEMKPVTIPG
jgi:3',5'-cyclic AMP phosphodiesterase CpdA